MQLLLDAKRICLKMPHYVKIYLYISFATENPKSKCWVEWKMETCRRGSILLFVLLERIIAQRRATSASHIVVSRRFDDFIDDLMAVIEDRFIVDVSHLLFWSLIQLLTQWLAVTVQIEDDADPR